MKKLCCLPVLILFLGNSILCQDTLVFKGIVKCYISNDERSTRGARNVIVAPGFIPKKTGITGQEGYYELNTGVPFHMLEDKTVYIHYYSACTACETRRTVFISSDQVRKNRKQTMSYITMPTLKMNAGCQKTELTPFQSDSIWNSCVRQPEIDLEKVSGLNVVTSSPSLVNLLTNLVVAEIIPPEAADYPLTDTAIINQGKERKNFGSFLFNSPMIYTSHPGFNFSPSRDMSEAVFWNPAALADKSHGGGASLFTNIKNNFKFAAHKRFNDKFVVGIGGIYSKQDEFRDTKYGGPVIFRTGSHLLKLNEYAIFLSPSYKLNQQLSVGISIKSIWQRLNFPDTFKIKTREPINTYIDSIVTKQHFDADISVYYKITPAFIAGINIMNIAGTQLFTDVYTNKQQNESTIPLRNMRSVGLGLCYKWKQLNIGTDVLISKGGVYEVTSGANYVPFNNALLSAGYAFKQKSFSGSFKWKQFRVAYIDDNNLMKSEKHPGKSKIFNGHIYSGFVFDFR
jgi:hypothetical protein